MASMWPPINTPTRLPRRRSPPSCPRPCSGSGIDECVAALGDPEVRFRVLVEMERGSSGWEDVAVDPGWGGIQVSHAASHPDWAGRSFAELGAALDVEPAELAFDALIDDRLDVSIVVDCMAEPDVEAIMAVPWIAVCTDAEGRRPGHPILDAGRPHPRTYGSTARVLGTYVRERGTVDLETAVAKLTSVPAARIGLRDRGVIREGAVADLVVFDPSTVADVATYAEPAQHPRRDRARHRQRPRGRAGRGRDRRAPRPPAPPGRMTAPAAESAEIAALPGGPIPYTLRRSPRARTLRVVIHPELGVIVTVPAPTRRGWAHPEARVEAFLADRERWLRRHLGRHAEARAELAARGGLRDGALLRYRGDLHRLRIEPSAPTARRSSVERVGDGEEDVLIVRLASRDRRPTSEVLADWFRVRARTAIDRDIVRHGAAMGVDPGLGLGPGPAVALGERVGPGPIVVLVAADPRAARGARDRRRPRARAPAHPRARPDLLVDRGGAAPRPRAMAALAPRPLARVARRARRSVNVLARVGARRRGR